MISIRISTAWALWWAVGTCAAHGIHHHLDPSEHHHSRDHGIERGLESELPQRCMTPEASLGERNEQKRALSLYQENIRSGRLAASEKTIVPVCFFVIQEDDGIQRYSDAQLQRQMDLMNSAYSETHCCNELYEWCDHNSTGACSLDTGLQFAWAKLDEGGNVLDGETVEDMNDPSACFIRVNNSDWLNLNFLDDRLRTMKEELRKGDSKVLNTYFTVLEGFLGYATFPWDYFAHPLLDGVIVDSDSMPDGIFKNYNEGDTLVHEIG